MITYQSEKISWNTKEELEEKIKQIEASKILSITPCIPDRTDTKQWVRVYYEVYK